MNFKELREPKFLPERVFPPEKVANQKLISELAKAQSFLAQRNSVETTEKLQAARESMAAFNILITQAEANNRDCIYQRLNTLGYLGGMVLIMSVGLYGSAAFMQQYGRMVFNENQDQKHLFVNFGGNLLILGSGLYGFVIEGLVFLEQLKPVYKMPLAALEPHMIEVLSYYYQQTDTVNSPQLIGQLRVDISRLDVTKFITLAIKNHSLRKKL